MKERLLKATPNVLSTVDMIILVLKKVISEDVISDIFPTNSGRGLTVRFINGITTYQISVDTDDDTVEFGVITDCRELINREYVSSTKAFEIFSIIKDTYTKKELVKVFKHFYVDSN